MLWKCVPTATPLFRLAPQLLSFLDPFAGWLAPGSIFHLSSGRELVDATGIVWKGRSGSGSPDHLVRLTHEFRADMCWWRAIDSRPSKRTQNAKDVCFVLGPRAAGRQDLVLHAPASSACAIFADAGLRRRVPLLCEAFGANGGPRGGAPFAAFGALGDSVSRKLILAPMGDRTAAAYVNYGVERSTVLTSLGRRVEEIASRL